MYFSSRMDPNPVAEEVVNEMAGTVGEHINAEIKVSEDVLSKLPKSLKNSAFEAAAIKLARSKNESVESATNFFLKKIALSSELIAPMLRVGLKEIFDSLGGQERAVQYYKELLEPKSKIRFQSVGLISDDLTAVKNRAAMLATRIAYGEILKPKRGGTAFLRDMEREYLEFHKSIQTVLDLGITSGMLHPNVAKSIQKEISTHAIAELAQDQKDRIIAIHAQAMKSITDEARQKVMAKYTFKTPSNDNNGPSLS